MNQINNNIFAKINLIQLMEILFLYYFHPFFEFFFTVKDFHELQKDLHYTEQIIFICDIKNKFSFKKINIKI